MAPSTKTLSSLVLLAMILATIVLSAQARPQLLGAGLSFGTSQGGYNQAAGYNQGSSYGYGSGLNGYGTPYGGGYGMPFGSSGYGLGNSYGSGYQQGSGYQGSSGGYSQGGLSASFGIGR